jgi:hypothetical protein
VNALPRSVLVQATRPDALTSCLNRIGLEAASIVAMAPDGQLEVLAADDVGRVLALLARHLDQGPALDALRSGTAEGAADAGAVRRRWPLLAPELEQRGISSAYGVPVRPLDHGGPVTRVLQLFADRPLCPVDLRLAERLARQETSHPTPPRQRSREKDLP